MAVLSKSCLSNKWHQIDEEWATAELVGLRMKVKSINQTR